MWLYSQSILLYRTAIVRKPFEQIRGHLQTTEYTRSSVCRDVGNLRSLVPGVLRSSIECCNCPSTSRRSMITHSRHGWPRRCTARWQGGHKFAYSDSPPCLSGTASIVCSSARTTQRTESSYAYGGYRKVSVRIHKKMLSYKYTTLRVEMYFCIPRTS